LLRPYSQKKSKGIVYFSFEELSVLLQIAEIEGISVKIHVIGDGALEIALDAFTKACSPGNPLRHKLVHVQLASTEQLQRILDLNLYVSIQPKFLSTDKKMAPQKIGKARYKEIGYPFQKMHEMGINLSFSSDSPIETCNPFQTLASSDPWLNRKIAFSYYTLGSAKSMFLEKSLGSIQTGFLADAFVCSNDIFSMSSSEIETLLPEKIMIHGKWVKEQDR
jgi:predicted amidohydrolase YtcJ